MGVSLLAKEAAGAGADILVAQGTEAGGHGVTRGLVTLVPEIVDALGGRKPVVAAGGIADGRGLAAALMLGAAGVLMGTRFYASQEAAGAQGAKERIREATGDDTLRSIVFDISRRNVWPAPFTGRCLRNAHADRWFGLEIELAFRLIVLALLADHQDRTRSMLENLLRVAPKQDVLPAGESVRRYHQEIS